MMFLPIGVLSQQLSGDAVPLAPTALTATAISSTEIDLAWTDNADNETGYRIETSANGTSGWSTVANIAANSVSYSVTGLTVDTLYYYRVFAVNGAGDSTASNVASATTAVTPITYVNASGRADSNPGSITQTLAKPTGVAEGDLIIMFGQTRNSEVATPTGGTTWNLVGSFGVYYTDIEPPPTANDVFYCWSKIAGSSEPANYSMALTDDGIDASAFQCVAFRNASSVEVLSAAAGNNAPSVSALQANALLSYYGSSYNTTYTPPTIPSGMIQANITEYTATNLVGSSIAYELDVDEGSTGARNWVNGYDVYKLAVNLLIT